MSMSHMSDVGVPVVGTALPVVGTALPVVGTALPVIGWALAIPQPRWVVPLPLYPGYTVPPVQYTVVPYYPAPGALLNG